MKDIRKPRWAAAALLALVFGALPHRVLALSRDRTIAQFHHTAWPARDGGPSQVTALAQTTDGYLWIGTARGLFRFDGVRFERYRPPPGVGLPSENIYALLATPDGALWISFRSWGLGFIKDGHFTSFIQPNERPKSWVYFLAADPDGRLWAGTFEGLALRSGSQWTEIGPEWHVDRGRVWSMVVARDGTLWAGIGSKLWFLRRGSHGFEDSGVALTHVKRLAQSIQGDMWVAEALRTVRPVKTDQTGQRSGTVGLAWETQDLLFDRDGTLWTTAAPFGLRRIRDPQDAARQRIGDRDGRVDAYGERDGLSGDGPNILLEDREGSIWVGTNKGLDRFRYSDIVPVRVPPGPGQMTLLPGPHGDIWIGSTSSKTLVHLLNDKLTVRRTPAETSCVYRDSRGDVWWGGFGAMWRQRGDAIDTYWPPDELRPPHRGFDWIWEIFGAEDQALWVRLGDRGLIHFKDGVWSTQESPPTPPPAGPSATFSDGQGRTWLGFSVGRVDLVQPGHVTSYGADQGLDIGRIKAIRGHGPVYWFGGESGLAMFRDGAFYSVVANSGEKFGTVSGIIEASDGTLWFNEIRGIIRIAPDQVRNLSADPSHRVTYQLFDYLDGLPGAPQMDFTVSTAVEASDGRLWFATDGGLARLDPTVWPKNTVPPPMSIVSVVADHPYSLGGGLRFPAGTSNVHIGFAALSLAIPERVRVLYKLEGIDGDWQDAGARRESFYTNLKPGEYTFRVKAANNDGVWNETGTALSFDIPPSFSQTWSFIALCSVATAMLFAGAYVIRLRQVAGRLERLYQERMDERTRIARELHDTLLQGFLSASLQLHLVVDELPDDSPAKPMVANIIRLVSDVNEEGRQAIRGLRMADADHSLEDSFSRAAQELGAQPHTSVHIAVLGHPRALNMTVRDQVHRIGREALFNALKHAKARQIDVDLAYLESEFVLTVRDDGHGMEPRGLDSPESDRWGLAGMHERSQTIGAVLSVTSSSGRGTEVTLSIPADAAYARTAAAHRRSAFMRLRTKSFFWRP